MFVIPIMVFLSWQTGNNLWAYLALGLAVFSTAIKAASEQAVKQKTAKQLNNGIEDLLKGLKATQN